MSKPVNEETVKVGMLVYMVYGAQRPGIVRRLAKPLIQHLQATNGPGGTPIDYALKTERVEVEWIKPDKNGAKVTTVELWDLMDFEDLVESHRRKYAKQSGMVDELRRM